MPQSFTRCLVCILALLSFSLTVFAESNDAKKIEEMIPLLPKDEKAVDITTLKRAKLSEEQAINQLKYMMVKGFARMEEELQRDKSFPPFGLALMPDGEFKAVIPDTGEENLNPAIVLPLLAKQMEAIAQTRSMWAVGLMYIRKIKRDDGSYATRIIVMTEHIAGWARHWTYPFKVENGEVKLGKPTESAAKPIYYVKK